MGIEYKILPWKEESALEVAHKAFVRWKNFQGSTQTEDQKIISSIRDFIDKHGDSRFSSCDDEKTIYDRAGWYKRSENKKTYMIISTALVEAGGGHDKDRVVETLVRYQWLVDKDSDNRFTKKTRINGELKNLYHVRIPDAED